MTHRLNNIVASVLFGFAIVAPSFAVTPPVLTISDDAGNSIAIDSTGTTISSTGTVTTSMLTATPGSGTITWSGTIGNFSITTLSGESKPLMPIPSIDLGANGGNIQTGAGGGTLTMKWSDTGFTNGSPNTTLNGITGLALGGTISYTAYIDGTNALNGTGTMVTSQPATGNSGTVVSMGGGPITPTFSMTEVAVLTVPAGSYSTFDLQESVTSSTVTLACPASGTQSTAYTGGFTATGGTPPYTYALTSGTIPAGLNFNPSTGAFTGTPTTPLTYAFSASVKDSKGDTDVADCSMTIGAMSGGNTPSLTVLCPAATGVAGVKYADLLTLSASGGKSPYTFSETGSLDGMTLNPSGIISGTALYAGTFTFTATAKDATSGTAITGSNSSCKIVISSPPPKLSFTCASSTGSVGVPYNSSIKATGGVPAYTYYATGLPTGLSINATTGAITGTPTAPGTFNVKVTVKDSSGNTTTNTCSSGCTITIACTVLGTISGYVYDDLNASKTYNSGDKAFSGVTVTLTGGGKTVTTTSNSSGFYSFSNLALGNYAVSAPSTVSSASETIDTPTSISVNLNSNNPSCQTTCQTSSTNNDFGYVGTSTVSGKCYTNDYWGGNHYMGGQQVTISGKDCFGHTVSKTTTTDGNGNYSCNGLYPGSYTVSAPSKCDWQGGYHTIQTNSTYNVGCQSGDSHQNLNFCYNWGW
jgi:hypothetical protein